MRHLLSFRTVEVYGNTWTTRSLHQNYFGGFNFTKNTDLITFFFMLCGFSLVNVPGQNVPPSIHI